MIEESHSYTTTTQRTQDLQQPEATETVPTATWLRFTNFLIDYIAFIVLAIVIGVVAVLAFNGASLDTLLQIPELLLGILLMCIYYLPFGPLNKKTPKE